MSDLDDDILASIFTLGEGQGAVQLTWEVASRCVCYSADSRQPNWGCPTCSGSGVAYAAPQTVAGLFRSQSRWLSFRREGELDHGEAQLTTPLSVKPGYSDRRVRDRLTVPVATGDSTDGRVFYPAAPAVPFLFNNVQRAWRVQLQSAETTQQLNP